MKLLQLNEPLLELVNHEADDLGVSDVAGTVPTEVRSGATDGELGKRWSKKTDRWLEHFTIKKKGRELQSKILRKSSAVNDFCTHQEMLKLWGSRCLRVIVSLKMLMEVHKKINFLLPINLQEKDEERFDDINEKMLFFKNKIHNWIKDAE